MYEEKGILGKESTVWEVCMVAVIRVGHKRVRTGTKTRSRSKARKQGSAVWGLYLYGQREDQSKKNTAMGVGRLCEGKRKYTQTAFERKSPRKVKEKE